GRVTILYSLTGSTSDELAELIFQSGFGKSSEDSPVVVMLGALDPGTKRQVLGSVVRSMWRRDKHRERARLLSFEDIRFPDRYRFPTVAALAEAAQQFALPEEPSAEQIRFTDDFAEAFYEATFRLGLLDRNNLIRLTVAWKGATDFTGWGGLEKALAGRPDIRGGLAYLLGHRYVRLGKPADAERFFELAVADAAEESMLAELARADLEMLRADRGLLLVTSDYPDAVRVIARQDGDAVAEIDVDSSETIDLVSGAYEFALAESPSDRYLSKDRIEVSPAGRYRLKINWLWKPGSAERRLPGLVPRPAELPGVGRWQLETRNPREVPESIGWQPGGDLVACGTGTGDLRVYDVEKGRLAHFGFAHAHHLRSLAWSPDGKWIATWGFDDRAAIRLWSSDGTPGPVLEGHKSLINELVWHPNGRRIASRSADHTIRIWSVDGDPLAVLRPDSGSANSVAWSPDGKWLATAGKDATVRLWDADGNAGPVLEGHSDAVNRVAFSPDGGWLASTSDDGTVRLWQADGTPGPVMKGDAEAVIQLAWSPDSQLLAAVGSDTEVQLWKVDGTRGPLLGDHEKPPVRIAWSPDGKWLASAAGRTLRFWAPDGTPAAEEGKPGSRICCLSWNSDGTKIALGCGDASVHIRGVDGVEPAKWGGVPGMDSLAWSPDGEQLALPLADETFQLWRSDGTPGTRFSGHTNRVYCVAWGPDGQLLASGGADKSLRLWTTDGTQTALLKGHKGSVWSVDWSPDGERIVSGSEDSTVRLWQKDGTETGSLEGHESRVTSVAWSPTGGRLASAGNDDTVRIWNPDGTPQHVTGGGQTEAVAWSPDGQTLALAGNAGFQLWNPDANPDPTAVFTGACHATGWSSDGSAVAVGLWYNLIRVYDHRGELIKVLDWPGGGVDSLAWKPAGKHLACSDWRGFACVGNAESGEAEWGVLLPAPGRPVTFRASGEFIDADPELVESDLVYLVEKDDGRLEILKPSEFQARVLAAAGPNSSVRILPSARPASEKPSKPLFSFGVIADVQYRDADPAGSRYYRKAVERLEQCVEDFNGRELAFTLQLGDFIDKDFASFDAVMPVYEKLKTKRYHVLGNHDFSVEDEKKGEVLKRLGLEKGYYHFVHGGWRFIVLDGNELSLFTTEEGSPKREQAAAILEKLKAAKAVNAVNYNGALGDEQLRWLKKQLEEAAGGGEKVV
ncbi:MAG: PD40 domain-containing protein, partial [Planctomycetes bacterium]|nr:PD40 domain-containing protein [Planctomycetota bacterium]